MNRRQFLQTFALGAAAVNVGALGRALAAQPNVFVPAPRSAEAHAMARLTYGVTPALYSHVESIGAAAFVEEQLNPAALNDDATEGAIAPFRAILNENGGILAAQYENQRRPVYTALLGGTLLRGLLSQRQLYERMVEFCGDHFYIYLRKGPTLFLKIDDDSDVARRYALGRFRDLLGASARSPAMLVYLDNAQSAGDQPNENYSRELLELHTLGVGGGYSEDDVKAVARCFTGWTVNRRRADGEPIVYQFRQRQHVGGAKTVLGVVIPEGGEAEGDAVLDLLAAHPSTARFVCTKLARRFVADAPPQPLIDALAANFASSSGDLSTVLRTLFSIDDFLNALPKLKRPYEYVLSVLRALDYRVEDAERFLGALNDPLEAMGQVPFLWPAPNGYPDVGGYWQDNLLPRWQFALAAVGGSLRGGVAQSESLLALLEAQSVALETQPILNFLGRYLLGRDLTDAERSIIVPFASDTGGDIGAQVGTGMVLLLASPAFQYK